MASTLTNMRTALKVMSPILLWCSTSEEDGGNMSMEAEPSHQYSVTSCCRVTDGSRVWQNGVWHGSADGAKVCQWIPLPGGNYTHWHSLRFAEHLWRPNSGCQHSEAVGIQYVPSVNIQHMKCIFSLSPAAYYPRKLPQWSYHSATGNC